MRDVSMKRMSPPTGVHARPVATPGTLVRSATSLKKRTLPRWRCKSSDSDVELVRLAVLGACDFERQRSAQLQELAVELPTPASRV